MVTKQENKRVFFNEYQRIKFQIGNIERDVNLFTSRSNVNELKEIVNGKQNYGGGDQVSPHIKYKKATSSKIAILRQRVKIFKQHLVKNKADDDFVEKIREHMKDVESRLTSFKKQHQDSMVKLIEEEEKSSEELKIMERKIHQLLNNSYVTKKSSASHRVDNNVSSNLPEDVVKFQKYVSEHGKLGGWDDFDHNTFLQFRNKYKDKDKFIQATIDSLAGRNYEQVVEHEKWYQLYQELYGLYKSSILKWRKNKQNEISTPRPTSKEDEKIRKEISEEEKLNIAKEKEIKKEKIQNWKKSKLEHAERIMKEKKMEEEKLKSQKIKEQQKMIEVRELNRRRQIERREEEVKTREFLRKKREEEARARGEEAREKIKLFQYRDRSNLDRKLEENRIKKKEEILRREKIKSVTTKINSQVEHDASRLHQPTDAWLLRQQTDDVTRSDNQSNFVRHISHKATPAWRKGV